MAKPGRLLSTWSNMGFPLGDGFPAIVACRRRIFNRYCSGRFPGEAMESLENEARLAAAGHPQAPGQVRRGAAGRGRGAGEAGAGAFDGATGGGFDGATVDGVFGGRRGIRRNSPQPAADPPYCRPGRRPSGRGRGG